MELVSDNGPQFISREFSQFLAERGIKHRKTAIYNPQCNGLVERFNRVLGGFIRTAFLSGDPDLKNCIYQQIFSYRNTPHPLTGVSPAVLLRGRSLVSPLCIADLPSRSWRNNDLVDIKEKVESAQAKIVTDRDFPRFQVGDTVRVRLPGIIGKDMPKLSPPIIIVEQVGRGTFRTADGRLWSARRLASCGGIVGERKMPVSSMGRCPVRVTSSWSSGPSLNPRGRVNEPAPIRGGLITPTAPRVRATPGSTIGTTRRYPSRVRRAPERYRQTEGTV